ncbi:MAG: response regulator transcription factor [Lachnospiraceae bacterium]|nr:response regulator transcription factor [Lachnospiraceae bacterium]
MLQILLVEDNKDIVSGLTFLLKKEGFEVSACLRMREAEETIDNMIFDLAIIDIGLPDGNGYEVCRYLKEARPETPVVFLTAKDEERDVVKAFDLGADDYVVKPFRNRELISRINGILRRYDKSTKEIRVGDLKLDLVANRLFRLSATGPDEPPQEAEEISLTALEHRIVQLLFQNRGITMTRDRILDQIWDYAGDVVNDNTLTVYIKRVREKLGGDVVKTVRGIGYRVDA